MRGWEAGWMDWLINFFLFLFSKHRCLVHTALGIERYFKAVNELERAGVSFRISTRARYTTYPVLGHSDNTQYDIFVKKEDDYKAQQAIQHL
jgi:hypothetical protein